MVSEELLKEIKEVQRALKVNNKALKYIETLTKRSITYVLSRLLREEHDVRMLFFHYLVMNCVRTLFLSPAEVFGVLESVKSEVMYEIWQRRLPQEPDENGSYVR